MSKLQTTVSELAGDLAPEASSLATLWGTLTDLSLWVLLSVSGDILWWFVEHEEHWSNPHKFSQGTTQAGDFTMKEP